MRPLFESGWVGILTLKVKLYAVLTNWVFFSTLHCVNHSLQVEGRFYLYVATFAGQASVSAFPVRLPCRHGMVDVV